jgi:Adenylate and Guanylate cyclase catalytic domain
LKVASGIPKLNGNAHIAEIASLALHIMKTITTLEFQNIPGGRLVIRIGISSGELSLLINYPDRLDYTVTFLFN